MRTLAKTLAACLVGSALMATGATAQVVTIATGAQGSLAYNSGQAVAKVANEQGITARTQPLVGYLPLINTGEVDFGFSNGVEAAFAMSGTGNYDRANPNLRLVGVMFPLRTGLMVVADTGIKTIEDLKAQADSLRIASEYTSSTIIPYYIAGALANGGMTYEDFQQVPVSSFVKGIEALGDGLVDVTLVSLNSGAGKQVEAKLQGRGGLQYVSLDTSDAAVAAFKEFLPAGDIVAMPQNDSIPGLKEAANIIDPLDDADTRGCLGGSGLPDDQGSGREQCRAGPVLWRVPQCKARDDGPGQRRALSPRRAALLRGSRHRGRRLKNALSSTSPASLEAARETENSDMMTRLTASDGHELDCWMEPANGDRRGGLVILQEIFGVTDQLKGVAARYAALGYEVAIPALFDRKERGAVIPFDKGQRGRDMMLASTLSETMTDVEAAVQALAAKGSAVAVMGFCWGGGLALRAAQTLPVAGAVAFYGTRLPQYLDRPLRAPLLCHFGTRDEHVPPEMIEQVKACLTEAEVHMYEAGHAFANDARPSYVAAAADLAHQRTEAFLAKHLG